MPTIDVTTHAALQYGTRLGPYLIISSLGDSGSVYKAQDTELNRIVALKILPPRLRRDAGFMKRFRREAQVQARITNPNVIALHSMFDTDSGLVLVMEYVEGQTLAQLIRNHGALPIDEALWIFEQVLHGVERAHAADIVHRDLKPANIFIAHDRSVKIMDFGLAKIQDQRLHSLSGVTFGTLLYTPPELVNGKHANARSDIYTIGISLFEALTGRLPFQQNSDYALMHAHLKESPPSPRALRQTIPSAVEAVVLKAIEKDPARRFQSAGAFRHALIENARLSGIELSDTEYGEVPSSTARTWERQSREILHRLKDRLYENRKIRRRVLGIAFDLSLLATIFGLIFLLGLIQFPIKSTDQTDTQAKRSDTAPKSGSVNGQNKQPAAPQQGTGAEHTKKKDNYEGLRKAWGG